MNTIFIKCKNCGANLEADLDKKIGFCIHCGTKIVLPELNKTRVEVIEKKFPKAFRYIIAAAIGISVIGLFIILSIFSANAPDGRIFKTAGIYLAGRDIPAGDYVLYPNAGEPGFFEIRKTEGRVAERDDFICSKDFYARQWVSVNEGEYLEVRLSDLYKPENVKVAQSNESGFDVAQFKVGVDIPEGEYLLCGYEKLLFYMITSTFYAGTQDLNAPEVLELDNCEYRQYVKLKNGQYIYFTSGRLYALNNAPEIVKNDDGSFKPGQYKLGRDFPYAKFIISPYLTNTHRYYVNREITHTNFVESFYPEFFIAEELLTEPAEFDFSFFDRDGDIYLTLVNCTMKSCEP